MFNRLGNRIQNKVEVVDARDILSAKRKTYNQPDARTYLNNRRYADKNRRQSNGRNNRPMNEAHTGIRFNRPMNEAHTEMRFNRPMNEAHIEMRFNRPMNFQNRRHNDNPRYGNNHNNNTRNTNKMDTQITLPIKTIKNNHFDKYKSSFPVSIKTNKKVSGSYFSDPKRSMGLFANSIKEIDTLKTKPNYPYKRSSIESYNDAVETKKVFTEPFERPINEEDNFYPVFTIKNDKMISTSQNFQNIGLSSGSKKPALSTSTLSNRIPVKSEETVVTNVLSPIQGYRIEVKNLHPQVTLDDINELFTSLNGKLRACTLVRPGYAEVVFSNLRDAEKAIEEFHGRDLDERPMNLKLVTPSVEAKDISTNKDVANKIASIQISRKSSVKVEVSEEAIFRSLYAKSLESTKTGKKSFKFSVTL